MENIRELRRDVLDAISNMLECASPGDVRMRLAKLTYPDLVWLKQQMNVAHPAAPQSDGEKWSNPADSFLPESDVRFLEWLRDAIRFLAPEDATVALYYESSTLHAQFRHTDGRATRFAVRIERTE
jgi:hypothetical protein